LTGPLMTRAKGKELEENGFGVVLEKRGEGLGLPPPFLLLGLPVLGKPLFAVLAFPGLFGFAGLFVGPLDELGIGRAAVDADRRLGAELLFDVGGKLAVLAELLRLELGVGNLPETSVLEWAGELLGDSAQVFVDLRQGVGEDVYPDLPGVVGELDLGVVPG
jgi:hypothetical protein